MTDVITSIKYDEKDPKFIQIKNEFTAEIQKRFSCDNYEDITKYVFGEVFQKQHSKETCIKELESIFNDKTEEIINYLWNLVDRVVNEHEDNNNAKGDVLDKIFKDDNKKKPFIKQDSKEKKGSGDFTNDRYNTKRQDRRKGSKDYQKGNNQRDNRDRYHNNRKGNYGNKFNNSGNDRMRVGNKEVIIHSNRRRERSRSRSDDNDNSGRYDDDYQGNYPPQRGGHYQRGMYPPMSMRYGPYYQQYPMMGYMDPRRQFYRPQKHQNKQDNQPKEGEEESNPNEPIEQQNPVESKPGEPVPQQPGQEEKQPENESEPKEKKKIRCKNWPHCTDKNCIYTHPTTTCPYFPNCMFGDKCSYIHPNIPCKYGFYCTRIGCAYSHPPGWNPGMGMYPNMMQPIPFYKHKGGKKFQKGAPQGEEEPKGKDQPPQDQPTQPQEENPEVTTN